MLKERVRAKADLLGAALLTALSLAVAEIGWITASLAQVTSCQCTTYVANKLGLTKDYPHAGDWDNGYLGRNGYTKVSAPQVGAIAVMERNFSGANPTYGHVGIVNGITQRSGNTYITLKGANQSVGTLQPPEAGCNNVKITSFASQVNARPVSFWIKGSNSLTFAAGASSRPAITVQSIDLTVSASNLPGKTVYVQMWRGAANGFGPREWNYSKPATGTSLSFTDMDGVGNTFAGVSYYMVASLTPLAPGEAAKGRTSCYSTTGGRQLCDVVRR